MNIVHGCSDLIPIRHSDIPHGKLEKNRASSMSFGHKQCFRHRSHYQSEIFKLDYKTLTPHPKMTLISNNDLTCQQSITILEDTLMDRLE